MQFERADHIVAQLNRIWLIGTHTNISCPCKQQPWVKRPHLPDDRKVGKTNGCTLELNVACLPTEVSLHDKTSNWWYGDSIGSELPSVSWHDVGIGWRWFGGRHGPKCPAFLFTRVDYIETKCIYGILCAVFKKLLLAHDLLQMLFFEIVKKKLFSKKQNQPINCQWAKILKSGLHFWFLCDLECENEQLAG